MSGAKSPAPTNGDTTTKSSVAQGKTDERAESGRTPHGQSRTPGYAPNTSDGAQPEHNRSTTTPKHTDAGSIDPDVLALAQKLATLPAEARAALKGLLE